MNGMNERMTASARWRWARPAAAAGLLVATAWLAACSHVSDTAATRIGDRDMRNRVELVRIVQPLAGDDPAAISGRARAFLETIGFGYGDQLAVAAAPDFPAEARADLERLVRAYGGELVAAPPLPREPGAGEALIVVERYRVTSPQCPAFRLDMSRNYGNAPSPQFGCANLLNLGAMVAAPRHLLTGVPAGDNDAERAAAALEAWRASPPVILMPSDTSQTASAGGG